MSTSSVLKKRVGFGLLKENDPDRMQKIASSGGYASQATGRAHRFTPEEGRLAAKKSVEARAARRKGAPQLS